MPGRLDGASRRSRVVSAGVPGDTADAATLKAPLRGALVVGAPSVAALAERLRAIAAEASAGRAPAPAPPEEADIRQPERLAIDYGDAAELAARAAKALEALASDAPGAWKALRAQGVFRGRGPGAQGRVPLHRPGLAVREHAEGAPRRRADRRRHLRARRPGDDAAPRQAAHRLPLRPRGLRDDRAGRGGAQADGDHAARGPGDRHRAHPPAGGIRHRPRHGDGAQPGRVRRPGRGRRAAVRGRAGSGERARARDGEPHDRGLRRHGRRDGAARRGRAPSSPASTATSSSPT